jgi:hypothetical protein
MFRAMTAVVAGLFLTTLFLPVAAGQHRPSGVPAPLRRLSDVCSQQLDADGLGREARKVHRINNIPNWNFSTSACEA